MESDIPAAWLNKFTLDFSIHVMFRYMYLIIDQQCAEYINTLWCPYNECCICSEICSVSSNIGTQTLNKTNFHTLVLVFLYLWGYCSYSTVSPRVSHASLDGDVSEYFALVWLTSFCFTMRKFTEMKRSYTSPSRNMNAIGSCSNTKIRTLNTKSSLH